MNENRLASETSPYLLQHAHNPVDWYPWGQEAIEAARQQDKPILVSIGYAACHWCHVMEKESFEDEAVAEIMNQYFINIKVDREERPDIDHIYMDALQAMTGSGGWPLNVFLTPGLNPFFGGTYFPPVNAYNRMSWKETLLAVHNAFLGKRDDIEAQGNNLVEHLSKSNAFTIKHPDKLIAEEEVLQIAPALLQQGDTEWGGFGKAPKFPHTFLVRYLLKDYYHTNRSDSATHAILSIDKLIYGGIYDQLGGGFARYSTDEMWLAPHFEKMLYDNALLLETLAEAFQLTGFERYKKVIDQTVGFIERELTSIEHGFYSAYDADSEGVEGKYYTWSYTEIETVLGKDAGLFCRIFNIKSEGNWEHTNILWRPESLESIAAAENTSVEELEIFIERSIASLFSVRQERIKPQLDDKQLLNWNALMITGLCKAYAATGNETPKRLALSNIEFIETKFYENGALMHSYKNGKARIDAFLDDYSNLITAYLQLQEITGELEYLHKARVLLTEVLKDFSDEENLFFYYTAAGREDVIVRKKEVYDGAVPSSNAVMADVLLRLGKIFGEASWIERSNKMVSSLKKAIIKYPTSFGYWASVLADHYYGLDEVAIMGTNISATLAEYLGVYHPNRILQSGIKEINNFPLLNGKPAEPGTRIYLCKDYSCQQPLNTINALKPLLKTVKLKND